MKTYKAQYVNEEQPMEHGGGWEPVLQIWEGQWLDSGNTGSGVASISGQKSPIFRGNSSDEVRRKAENWRQKYAT